jgi:hypothetical protein
LSDIRVLFLHPTGLDLKKSQKTQGELPMIVVCLSLTVSVLSDLNSGEQVSQPAVFRTFLGDRLYHEVVIQG